MRTALWIGYIERAIMPFVRSPSPWLALLLLGSACVVQAPDRLSGDCGRCHSIDDSEGYFRAPGGITDPSNPLVGAHYTHIHGSDKSVGMACYACHPVPATVDSPGHLDGVVQVEWGQVASTDGQSKPYDGTCTVWCHGPTDPTDQGIYVGGTNNHPNWTIVDGSQVVCGSCHSLPPPPPHPASNQCYTCHDATVGPGPVIVHKENHINGVVNLHPGVTVPN